MEYSKSQKGNRVLLYKGYMNNCWLVFKMELLFGDADITGLLNAVQVLGLKTIK